MKHLYWLYYHYVTYITVNYSSNSNKINFRLAKVDAEPLWPPPKFQVNLKIQLNTVHASRLSLRFLYYYGQTRSNSIDFLRLSSWKNLNAETWLFLTVVYPSLYYLHGIQDHHVIKTIKFFLSIKWVAESYIICKL